MTALIGLVAGLILALILIMCAVENDSWVLFVCGMLLFAAVVIGVFMYANQFKPMDYNGYCVNSGYTLSYEAYSEHYCILLGKEPRIIHIEKAR